MVLGKAKPHFLLCQGHKTITIKAAFSLDLFTAPERVETALEALALCTFKMGFREKGKKEQAGMLVYQLLTGWTPRERTEVNEVIAPSLGAELFSWLQWGKKGIIPEKWTKLTCGNRRPLSRRMHRFLYERATYCTSNKQHSRLGERMARIGRIVRRKYIWNQTIILYRMDRKESPPTKVA